MTKPPADIIDSEMAQKLQNKCISEGDLVIWTVYENPSDMPGKFVARPFLPRYGAATGLRSVLVADTLPALQKQLPWGLTWNPRQPGDDAVIVETWI